MKSSTTEKSVAKCRDFATPYRISSSAHGNFQRTTNKSRLSAGTSNGPHFRVVCGRKLPPNDKRDSFEVRNFQRTANKSRLGSENSVGRQTGPVCQRNPPPDHKPALFAVVNFRQTTNESRLFEETPNGPHSRVVCGSVAGVGAALGEPPGLREDAPAPSTPHDVIPVPSTEQPVRDCLDGKESVRRESR